jgi:hypothetical protein
MIDSTTQIDDFVYILKISYRGSRDMLPGIDSVLLGNLQSKGGRGKMKRVMVLSLVLMFVFGLAAWGTGKSESATPSRQSANWKIGVMTSSVSQGEELFRTAERLIAKYPNNLIVKTFPDNFTTEQETTISTALSIVSDPNVKVMIFCQGLIGTLAACQKIKEIRPEVVILCGSFNESVASLTKYTDVFYREDMPAMGKQIVEIARNTGCTTIVHYSFPRHLANAPMAQRLRIIKDEAPKVGIQVVELMTPDPTSDAGVSGTQQFVLADVPRQIQKYGPKTMFFGTNTAQLEPMIKAVVAGKAYYYPSVQSVFTGYTGALGLSIPPERKFDVKYYVEQVKQKLAAAGCTGHMGAWVVPFEMFELEGGFLYAKAYCEGKTGGKRFDIEVFKASLSEAAGGKPVFFTNVVDAGVTYDNGLFVSLPYETF